MTNRSHESVQTTARYYGKSGIEEVYKLIEESGLKLSEDISFDNDQRSIIQVIDDAAETSDETILFESYGAYGVLDFLKREGYLQ